MSANPYMPAGVAVGSPEHEAMIADNEFERLAMIKWLDENMNWKEEDALGEEEEEEDEEDEEEVQSWVCSSCCGYWHATKAQYDERPCCDNCAEKDNDSDSDNESVHSTCCMDCDESFEFDEPVSAEDYHDGNHEMRCPTCRAKPTGLQRFITAFGRAPSDLEHSVLRGCEWNWTAKQIVASLKATNPDINKTAVNSILYKALTKSLVIKHEHDNAPPTWSIKH